MNGLEVSWEDHLTHMDVVHVLYTVSRCRWLFHWIPSAAHKPVYTCNTHTHTHSCHTREVLLDSIMHISKCTQYVMEMTYVVWCRLLMSSPCKTSLVSNNKWSHSIWPAWPLPTCWLKTAPKFGPRRYKCSFLAKRSCSQRQPGGECECRNGGGPKVVRYQLLTPQRLHLFILLTLPQVQLEAEQPTVSRCQRSWS